MTKSERSTHGGRNQTMIFVGGLHRSGTTVVAQVVSGSPQASGLTETGAMMDEGQFLQDAYPQGSVLGGPTAWALNPRAHLTERDVENPDTLREQLWNSWSPYWDLSREFLVEKTPLNILRSRYLQAAFPDSGFLFVVRHPMLQALAVEKWYPDMRGKMGFRLAGLVELWCTAHETLSADLPHLRSASVAKYEHIVQDPVGEFERVGREIKLPAELKVENLASSRSERYSQRWEQMAVKRASKTVRPRSRVRSRVDLRELVRDAVSPLLRREYAAVVRDYEPRIQPFGYSLEDLTAVEPWPPSSR